MQKTLQGKRQQTDGTRPEVADGGHREKKDKEKREK